MLDRVLDIAILGLLMERDHHGYEVRTQLRDRLGMWANVSFGSIYPALARLERHGFVEARSARGASTQHALDGLAVWGTSQPSLAARYDRNRSTRSQGLSHY